MFNDILLKRQCYKVHNNRCTAVFNNARWPKRDTTHALTCRTLCRHKMGHKNNIDGRRITTVLLTTGRTHWSIEIRFHVALFEVSCLLPTNPAAWLLRPSIADTSDACHMTFEKCIKISYISCEGILKLDITNK